MHLHNVRDCLRVYVIYDDDDDDKLQEVLLQYKHSYKLNPLLLPTDAHNVKKRRVIKTF